MSESVPLSRLCPIGALPSSRIPTTSSLICSSSFPFRGPRNRSSSGLIAVSSSGSKFPIFSVVKNGQGSVQELDNEPISIELLPICSETQFDLVIAEAKQLHQGAIVVWMANWCRKCIYLKPKLERLAADYHPSLRFYCVDVNNVPHKLVARAGVTFILLFHVSRPRCKPCTENANNTAVERWREARGSYWWTQGLPGDQ
ncbi:Thioredoxin-like 3-2, chloroplastic [Linum perenne]